jgi:hypothetical protein
LVREPADAVVVDYLLRSVAGAAEALERLVDAGA